MKTITLRDALRADVPAFKSIIEKVELFPADFLDDMTASYFNGNPNNEIWRVAEHDSVAGFAYCAPERMTQGTNNMLLLAVAPEHQRQGIGAALITDMEEQVRSRGSHLLLVETSALSAFDDPRRLYASHGFSEIARIADYYQNGEGKVIFAKHLRHGGQS
jgi:ribosomal protein S18 acetylase RimI-like enzyme